MARESGSVMATISSARWRWASWAISEARSRVPKEIRRLDHHRGRFGVHHGFELGHVDPAGGGVGDLRELYVLVPHERVKNLAIFRVKRSGQHHAMTASDA